MGTTETIPTGTGKAAPKTGKGRSIILLIAVVVIATSRAWIPGPAYDWMNVIPLVAVLYVGYAIIALDKTFGYSGYIRRALSTDPAVRKPRGSFLVSPYVRSFLLIVVALGVAEFALRCRSLHRALVYERQGNLLFTPIPNQKYIEKISLTPSTINSYGLRGEPVPASAFTEGNPTILCLGDSVTYGYGVDDAHSYPADLERILNRNSPGRYAVLNAGVDAYPISLEDQKFLYLWKRGIRPAVAVVGYSFNEGGVGLLAFGNDEAAKTKFAARVREKNFLRSFALYTLVVENWARSYYDKIKGKLIPGTNFTNLSDTEAASLYRRSLERLLSDLRAHQVKPVFVLFAGFDGRTKRYDDQGALQLEFAQFAEQNNIPLLRTKEALAAGEAPGFDIKPFFIDHAHMNNSGTEKVAEALAQILPKALAGSSSAP
jgi:lysophospholipase L1-like esterase